MEKLLSIVIPVYNTEEYLPKCLDSIIIEDKMHLFEALIIIDGSPDNSVQIAKQYQEKYPDTFRVIEKENGGHSSAINKGFELAEGKYFKLLDSDDWFDTNAFSRLLDKLRETDVDIIFTNFVYEYVLENRQERICLDVYDNKVFTFSDIQNISDKWRFLLIHSMVFKTELLSELKLELPPKVFYGDTYLVIVPVFLAKKLEYCNVDLYRYLIGREGQSVSPEIFLRRRNDLIVVMKAIIKSYIEHEKYISDSNSVFILYYISSRVLMVYELIDRLSKSDRKIEWKAWSDYVNSLSIKSKFTGKLLYVYRYFPFSLRRLILKVSLLRHKIYNYFVS